MTKNILIVEDNNINRKIYADVLAAYGYVTDETDGTDLFEKISSFKPHLILMDILLADCNGIDLVRDIRKNSKYKDLPVIAVTAFAMKGEEEQFYQAGFNSFLPKPTGLDDLLKEVKKFL